MHIRTAVALLFLVTTSCTSSRAQRLDRYLTRSVPFGFSGAVLIADRSGVILDKGYGVPRDGIFDMGSITKAITATAIAKLDLSLDDTLPKYFDGVPPDKQSITLLQLLTHTAGLVDLTGGDYDNVSREQLVRDVMDAPLVSKPGAEWHYSNAGFSLLAAIIENVSGREYEAFLRERMFAPAGMRETGYALPASVASRVPHTYTERVDHGSPYERLVKSGGAHWVLLGNGGMLTTTRDLYAFARSLHDAPPKLFTPWFKKDARETQALGWYLEKSDDGHAMIHHGGDAPELGVNAELRIYPDDGVVIVVLANTRLNGGSTRRAIVPMLHKILFGGASPAVPIVSRAPRLEARTIAMPDGGRIEVRVEGDHLVAGAIGQNAIDALTVQRSESSLRARRELNAKAMKVVPPNAEILGTSRRDRGVFMTTFRAHGKTFRFSWLRGEPIEETDDGTRPHDGIFSESPIAYALKRPFFWNGTEFVFYDLYADETLRLP
ncbi:MAG: beta-lactamase [Acidobacteria bacterium]|nr:beta-lactamase [Acidobacteriota bacterium]